MSCGDIAVEREREPRAVWRQSCRQVESTERDTAAYAFIDVETEESK